jgi:hypothetical protein
LNNDSFFNFLDVTEFAGLSIESYNYYGASFADVNRDGYLDFYLSKYYNNFVNPQIQYSSNFYMIGANNVGLTKKHLTGVTQAAEDASEGLNGESFDEQIESLKSLVGHRIQLSKLRQVILGDKEDVPQINHRKFDAFNNSVRFAASDGLIKITNDQRHQLFTESEKITTIQHDFYIDAFWAFQVYLRLFNKQDSHIIKNETDRIMKMTQWAVRNNVLEALGI